MTVQPAITTTVGGDHLLFAFRQVFDRDGAVGRAIELLDRPIIMGSLSTNVAGGNTTAVAASFVAGPTGAGTVNPDAVAALQRAFAIGLELFGLNGGKGGVQTFIDNAYAAGLIRASGSNPLVARGPANILTEADARAVLRSINAPGGVYDRMQALSAHPTPLSTGGLLFNNPLTLADEVAVSGHPFDFTARTLPAAIRTAFANSMTDSATSSPRGIWQWNNRYPGLWSSGLVSITNDGQAALQLARPHPLFTRLDQLPEYVRAWSAAGGLFDRIDQIGAVVGANTTVAGGTTTAMLGDVLAWSGSPGSTLNFNDWAALVGYIQGIRNMQDRILRLYRAWQPLGLFV